MPFKIGSFNLIPSFGMMTICLAGIGALPYYARKAVNGEAPRIKDSFEVYQEWKKNIWDPEAPYSRTRTNKMDVGGGRAELEEGWKEAHVKLGNLKA